MRECCRNLYRATNLSHLLGDKMGAYSMQTYESLAILIGVLLFFSMFSIRGRRTLTGLAWHVIVSPAALCLGCYLLGISWLAACRNERAN